MSPASQVDSSLSEPPGKPVIHYAAAAAAAAKSLQSCPTLFDPIAGSPRGSPVPGILQARTLEWVANIKVIQIQCLIVIVLNAVSPVGSVAGKMLSEHKWEESSQCRWVI